MKINYFSLSLPPSTLSIKVVRVPLRVGVFSPLYFTLHLRAGKHQQLLNVCVLFALLLNHLMSQYLTYAQIDK
jgi:hypothetical protein